MADTSELLARTARLAYFDNPPVDEWDRLEATSKAAWLRVATAVTRLQAEAPEDVEVRAEAERMLHQIKTKSVPLLDWNARVARLATFVLQFRTSQAEAQAPTTAAQASVLTEDELERVKFLRRNIGDWTEADAADVCDLVLRVGAPAPAPTCEHENAVAIFARTIEPFCWKCNADMPVPSLSYEAYVMGAKGDTP